MTDNQELELLFVPHSTEFTTKDWKDLMLKCNQLGIANKQINEVKIRSKFGIGTSVTVDVTDYLRIGG